MKQFSKLRVHMRASDDCITLLGALSYNASRVQGGGGEGGGERGTSHCMILLSPLHLSGSL